MFDNQAPEGEVASSAQTSTPTTAQPSPDLLEHERLVHDLHLHRLQLEAEVRSVRTLHASAERECARLRELYDHAPMAYVTVQKETRIYEANLAASALFGLTRSDLEGKPLHGLVHPDDRGTLRSMVRSCLQQQVRTSGEVRLELAGSSEAVFRLIATPIRVPEGSEQTCKVALADVTTLKRAEERLRLLSTASASLAGGKDDESPLTALTAHLVPALGELCFADALDENGVLVRTANAAAGGPWATCAEALRRQAPPALSFDEGVAAGADAEARLSAVAGSGEEIATIVELLAPASVMIVPLVGQAGVIGRLVLARRQLSRAHSAMDLDLARSLAGRAALAVERNLRWRGERRATQSRRELTAIVKHEVKHFITTIGLSVNLLDQEAAHGAVPAPRHLERIKRAVDHLNNAVRDLDDLQGATSGRLSINPEPAAVESIIAESVELLSPLASQKQLDLKRGPSLPVAARCDRRRVLQVLWNLADNAIKFTPTGGTITLEAAPLDAQSFVRFTVTDTGPGISKNIILQLFEPNRRPGTKEVAGLGLIIAKGIVESHGGALWAEAGKKGGTAFHFTLPSA